MKRSARLIIFTATFSALLLVASTLAMAKISVNVSNNGDNSESSVKINSKQTSSSTSTIDSHTRVEIDQNGEHKVIETNKDEEIKYESSDGNIKVNINNTQSAGPTITQMHQDIKTKVEEKTKDIRDNVEKKIDEAKDDEKKEKILETRFKILEFFLSLWPF